MTKLNQNQFSYIYDYNTRLSVENGYKIISELGLWETLKNYEPPKDKGFMIPDSEFLNIIRSELELIPKTPGYPSCSFAITMRHLHFIAKNGIKNHKELFSNIFL
jgi:hypothetical protein